MAFAACRSASLMSALSCPECMCVLVPGKVDVGIFVVQILDSGTALVGFLALAFRTGRCRFNRAHNCLRGVRFAIHVGPHNAIDQLFRRCVRGAVRPAKPSKLYAARWKRTKLYASGTQQSVLCGASCKAKQVVRIIHSTVHMLHCIAKGLRLVSGA